MTFKEYYKKPIKESPDLVYGPFNSKLTYITRGARAFGTVYGIRDVSPFFVYGLKSDLTHYDMIEDVFMTLESTFQWEWDERSKIDKDIMAEKFQNALLFNKRWKVPAEDAGRVAQEIVNSTFLISKMKSELIRDYIGEFTWRTETGVTEIEKDLTNPVRTQLYRNSGRVWTNAKVISFWLTEDQLTPQILDDTFNKLKIADKDSYYIDVVNMKELEKEETRKKQLPSYKLYKTRKSAPSKDDRVLTDDEIRRAQQLMAKGHGVQGAQKAKFKDNLPEVGAKKYGKQMPLDVRQRVSTSESKKKI
jgi:hypothetical protein